MGYNSVTGSMGLSSFV